MLHRGHSAQVLISHEIEDFLTVFSKAKVELSSEVYRLALIPIFLHPFMDTKLVISISPPLEEIFDSAPERLRGLHFTVIPRSSLWTVIHNHHLQLSSFIFDKHPRVDRVKIRGGPYRLVLLSLRVIFFLPHISLTYPIGIRVSVE